MKPAAKALLRSLPSVDEFLRTGAGKALLAAHPRPLVLSVLRAELAALRRRALQGDAVPVDEGSVSRAVAGRAAEAAVPGVRRAVNATGVVLHTGLGRAPLAEEARAAVAEVAGACTLEIDAGTGERGQRDKAVAALLCRLTGAEAALVVNNNAAATLLLLNAMAVGREAVVSRGELVEIGGSYRMPEVMAAAGVRMVEVGTTNKTHLSDYAKAVRKGTTALLLKVHTSNYRVVGFHEEVGLKDLVALGRRHRLPVAHDLGSGALQALSPFGLEDEPRVAESLKAGVQVVCFSGDKLLGGPQAGILVGKRAPIEAMRRNPLARALRVGKMTLAALEATLRLHEDPERLRAAVPVWRMLAAPIPELQRRAEALAARLARPGLEAAVRPGRSQVGSGSVPAQELESRAVVLAASGVPAGELARRLRAFRIPVFTRVQGGKVWLDLRTLPPGDEAVVAEALAAALAASSA